MNRPTLEWAHVNGELTVSYSLEDHIYNFFEEYELLERELKTYELKRIHNLIKDSYTNGMAVEDLASEAVGLTLLGVVR